MKRIIFLLLSLIIVLFSGINKEFKIAVFDAAAGNYDSSYFYNKITARSWIIESPDSVIHTPVEITRHDSTRIDTISGDTLRVNYISLNLSSFPSFAGKSDSLTLFVGVKDALTNLAGWKQYVFDTLDVSTYYDGYPFFVESPAENVGIIMPFPCVIGELNLPSSPTLYQNYPNPFNPVTDIEFSLVEENTVTLSVYNSNGQLVQTLVKRRLEAGYHSVSFDAGELTSGVYSYTLDVGGQKLSKKMVLVK